MTLRAPETAAVAGEGFPGSGLTAVALIVGACAFFAFWANSVFTNDGFMGLDVSWAITLALHGVSIVLLLIGLAGVLRRASALGDQRLVAAGAGALIVGLLTVLPLAFVGMIVLGAAVTAHRLTPAGIALAFGGGAMLVVWFTGFKIGFEDSPDPDTWQQALAIAGIASAALGIAGLAFLSGAAAKRSVSRA